jgi:L-seryl-tRNA(Ser) seleniumtransferase
MKSALSKIPPMDNLLNSLQDQTDKIDTLFIKQIIENIISDLKINPSKYKIEEQTRDEIKEAIITKARKEISQLLSPSFKRVINGTGIILHTGLGRAPLGSDVFNKLENLTTYTNLEIELTSGKRGERLDHITSLMCLLTGADDAVVVNNNAAAVMLILNSLSHRKEVIVSRGELVEIGGSFRMPEVMKNSGAKMVEVGSTNKTHLSDYEEAITAKTNAILIVHPSNYKIIGFTQKPENKEILSLAHSHNLPVIFDLGSGALIDMEKFGFEYEPVVREVIAMDFDVVSFSGDKLLGGPQAGIIVGKKKYLQKIRKNHMLRTLRCDKIILAILSTVLKEYLHSDSINENNFTLKLFAKTMKEMKIQSERLLASIDKNNHVNLKIINAEGRAGSGAYPVYPIPSLALRIRSEKNSAEQLARLLRKQKIPTFGYISEDSFHLNLLTIFDEDIPHIAKTLNTIL